MIKGLTLIAVLSVLLVGSAVLAQEETPVPEDMVQEEAPVDEMQQEPTPEGLLEEPGGVVDAPPVGEPQGEPTIGNITGDAASYYGQTVTLEGNVDELVNIRSFVLGGGGLGNPQILVLNNTGREFNIGLTLDADVQVTGVIYPSANEGGWDQISNELAAGTTGQTQDAEATPDGESDMAEQGPQGVGLSEYPLSIFTDRFPDHTLMLVNSLDDIQFVETDDEVLQ